MPRASRNVLVSSASAKAPTLLALRDAAARIDPCIRIVAGDVRPSALAQYVADDFWVMPPTDAAHFDEIAAGCGERGIGTVIPTRDGELEFWSAHAGRLHERGVVVVVSAIESVRVTLDKLHFARACAALDVPAIPAALEPHGDGPFVVKERFGAGSRSIGLRLRREDAIVHAAGLQQPIFQPYVAGTEISVDAWCDRRGSVKGLVLRTRDCVVDGESKVTTTFRQRDLERRLARLLERLALSGPVVMQAILGDDGALHVIEVNARFGGASTASLQVGLDACYWTLLEADGGDLARHPFHRADFEVRQVRIPADLHQIQGA